MKDKRRDRCSLIFVATQVCRNQAHKPNRPNEDRAQESNVDDRNHCDDVYDLREGTEAVVVEDGDVAWRRREHVAASADVVPVDAHKLNLEEVPVGAVPYAVKESFFVALQGSPLTTNDIKDLFEDNVEYWL